MRTLLVIKKHILNLSRFVNVELYCIASCQNCEKTKALLLQKGVAFTEHDIDKDKSSAAAMVSRCNTDTVPQIMINNHHIGGYDDLVRLNDNNELDKMLGLAGFDDSNDPRRKTIIVRD